MKITIEIPDKDIPKQQDTMSVNFIFTAGYPCQCDYPFDVVEKAEDNNGKNSSN